MRPLLFLDVDGVLNIEPHETAVPHDEHHPGSAEHVFIPKGTRARVAELLEIFEPVWCTAWLGRAHATFEPLLDLKGAPWPHVNYWGLKLPELIKFAKDRPWVWIDDDANWELRELGWLPYERYVDGLIVVPDRRVGITDEHLDQLHIYAQQHS